MNRKGRMDMKLLCYQYKFFGPRAGLNLDGQVVDLTTLLGSTQVITDIGALLQLFDAPVSAIQEALDGGGERNVLPLDQVTLCPPILRPASVRDSSLFEAHSNGTSKRSGHTTPKIWYERPIYFYENPSVLSGPEAVIVRKPGSVTLDYEAELALVVGKRGSNVKPEHTLDYLFGVTIYNDWTDRAVGGQEVGFLGTHKSKDFAAGLGPWIVTMDEVVDRWNDGRLDLKVEAFVNGKQTTDSATGNMYWSIPQLFEVVTQDSVVAPGDVIGLGTVGGGCLAERGGELPYLSDGDTVEIRVERIGSLRQYVKK